MDGSVTGAVSRVIVGTLKFILIIILGFSILVLLIPTVEALL